MRNSTDEMISAMAPAVREMCWWLKFFLIWNVITTLAAAVFIIGAWR